MVIDLGGLLCSQRQVGVLHTVSFGFHISE
jgi:hypothetical protein